MRYRSNPISLATLRSRRASSPGFTLIELLVVIGIILILIGLFAAGAKHVTEQAKERDTKATLQICQTMFDNYKQATHQLSRPPPSGFLGASPITVTTYNATAVSPSDFWMRGQVIAPGSINPDTILLNDPVLSHRTATDMPEIYNTELVIQAMLSIPDNQKIFNNIPPAKVLKDAVTGYPLILDSWGNPILFVPAGGLGATRSGQNEYVWLDGTNYGVITTAGVITTTSYPFSLPSYDANNPGTGVMMQNQPFFVSAGPDGDVGNAHGKAFPGSTASSDMTDDNIYSFKN